MDEEKTVEIELDDETEVFEKRIKKGMGQQKNAATKLEVFLKKVLQDDLSWEGVAAIGTSSIIIWNIIRYLFRWGDSVVLSHFTKVPAYLLFMRKNQNFSDFYIVYPTIIMIFIIAVDIKPQLSKKLPGLSLRAVVLIEIFFVLALVFITIADFLTGKYISSHFYLNTLFCVRYSYRFIAPLLVLLIEAGKMDVELEVLGMIRPLVVCYKIVMLFGIYLISIFAGAFDSYHLFDQNDRVIVADLGSQYIVQDARFDVNTGNLYVFNSDYYIIDSTNENVKIIRGVYINVSD